MATRPPAFETSDKIWRKGCQGEVLTDNERLAFQSMARNRFNTFEMSATHAIDNKSEHEANNWIDLLVKGLVVELLDNPGLEREWQGSDFSDRLHGRQVALRLNQKTS